jgi:hypothetical protein
MALNGEACNALLRRGFMHLTVVDEESAAALAQFLSAHDCAVYPTGSTTMDVSPLGSFDVDRLTPRLAMHLKEWLMEIPGMAVRLDPTPSAGLGVIHLLDVDEAPC